MGQLGQARSTHVLLSGVRVRARCEGGRLDVTLTRPDGSPIADFDPLVVTTSDYLATGKDGFFGREKATIENGAPMRDAMVEVLRKRGGKLDPGDGLRGGTAQETRSSSREALVPAMEDHGVWLDQDERVCPAGPDPGQEQPEGSIGWAVSFSCD